ncbi:HAD family hydrolase [Psychrosphaera algicola]|uniref:Beta-phosphoglucomutase family hydrolase n=1 Tax=Psychrosphaera algicola TaxID=3023714 RepID=A0ABT5FDX1_9GAMM|nr:beta-phosphoglucomutase family hydrolase [Psychrosphaera sp. G1-22]MDC2889750.1 beta-phosphoglucomutase family hydrolase [Psychrosphaera sp. G1-22]
MDLSKYEGIIFDMDGTLVDSMPSHIEAWRLTCLHYGYPFDLDYMWSLGGVPTIETVTLLNAKYQLARDEEEVAKTKNLLWKQLNLTPSLINVTYDIFQQYLGVLPMGIGTGAERSHALELLQHHGLFNKINVLVTATDVTNGKPHPETFLSAADKMKINPTKCIVFEDTKIGAIAAQRAGMDCILVKNGQLIL